MKQYLGQHKFLLVLLILASIIYLANLGDRTITGDEAYTVLQAKTVLDHGYPHAFYKNFEILPKATYNIANTYIFNWTPWLESYITAVMLKIAGMNEFYLRLPFVLIGLATIALFYFFITKLTKEKFIIYTSTLLLATSITFILHVRQARWYSLSTFFALATWHTYLGWTQEKKSHWPMVASAALLFHSQLFTFFAVAFSLAVHYALFEIKKASATESIKRIAIPFIAITILTLPWFLATGQLATKSAGFTLNPIALAANLGIYGYYIAILLIPIILVGIFLIILIKNKERTILTPNHFIITILCASLFFLAVKGDLLPAIRYLIFLIPLFSIINAFMLNELKKYSKPLAIILLMFMLLGNYANVIPFTLARVTAQERITHAPQYIQSFIQHSTTPHLFLISYLYEITHHTTSTDRAILNIIKTKGKPADTFTTSHFPHTILIYTNLTATVPDIRVESFAKTTNKSITNTTPNWIIPRGFALEQEEIDTFLKEADHRYNLSAYEKIEIAIDDSERWASAPDPINHRFRTVQGTLIIYHK